MKKKRIEQKDALVQVGLQDSDNNEVTIIVSPREMIQKLMKQGRYEEAIAEVKKAHDLVGQNHPFYPYYQYKTIPFGNKMVLQHEPLDKEIAKRYPLSFKGKVTIDENEFEAGESLEEMLTRKRFSQEMVKIDMNFLETWIGEQKIENDFTLEHEAAKDGEWVIMPEKLPPPLRVKLVLRGDKEHIIVDYLEIRLTRISKKDNLMVISNEQQESSPYLLKLLIDFKDEQKQKQTFKGKVNFSVSKDFAGLVKTEKTILKFIKHTQECDTLDIVDLERQKSIFVTEEFSVDDTESLEVIDRKLAFLNELIEIEVFFDVEFRMGTEISSADYKNIDILKSIIKKEPTKNTFEETSLTFSDKKSISSFCKNIIDSKGVLISAEERKEKEINLFGASIKNIYTKWKFDNVRVADFEKLKNKLKYMEEGDAINVKFIPGTKNEVSCEYRLQEAKTEG